MLRHYEILKAEGVAALLRLHTLLSSIWNTVIIPTDWERLCRRRSDIREGNRSFIGGTRVAKRGGKARETASFLD